MNKKLSSALLVAASIALVGCSTPDINTEVDPVPTLRASDRQAPGRTIEKFRNCEEVMLAYEHKYTVVEQWDDGDMTYCVKRPTEWLYLKMKDEGKTKVKSERDKSLRTIVRLDHKKYALKDMDPKKFKMPKSAERTYVEPPK